VCVCVCVLRLNSKLNEEYCAVYVSKRKKKDYNQGISGCSETVHTDMENNSIWSVFVLCNFADLFQKAENIKTHNRSFLKNWSI